MNRRLAIDFCGLALLGGLVIVLYRKIIRLWWMWDDPFHINLLAPRSFWSILSRVDLWRDFTAHVFTPFFFVSMKSDLVLFGASARAFYVHDLIAVCAVALLFYVAMRLWVTPIPAFFAAVIAIASPAVAFTVTQSLARHYFEGAAFALIAVIAHSRGHRFGSAIAYFLAIGEKEVFVPLIILLFGISRRSQSDSTQTEWRSRLGGIAPHSVALVLYAIWRLVLTGMSLRAYGFTVHAGEWPMAIALLPARLVRPCVGHSGVAGAVLVAVVIIGVIAASRRRPLFAAIAFLCAIVPIAPVSLEMQARYTIAAWLLASAALCFLPRAALILPIIASVALVANRVEWKHAMRDATRMSEEARVFAGLHDGDVLYMPMTPPATLAELAGLTHSPGRWSYDQLPLCTGRLPAKRIFSYNDRAVRETRRELLAGDCSRIRRAPLSVRFRHEGNVLFWTFGPYEEGRYRVILFDGLQGFDVPPRIGYRVPEIKALRVRVRYDSPSGWATYSPDLDLKW